MTMNYFKAPKQLTKRWIDSWKRAPCGDFDSSYTIRHWSADVLGDQGQVKAFLEVDQLLFNDRALTAVFERSNTDRDSRLP